MPEVLENLRACADRLGHSEERVHAMVVPTPYAPTAVRWKIGESNGYAYVHRPGTVYGFHMVSNIEARVLLALLNGDTDG